MASTESAKVTQKSQDTLPRLKSNSIEKNKQFYLDMSDPILNAVVNGRFNELTDEQLKILDDRFAKMAEEDLLRR